MKSSTPVTLEDVARLSKTSLTTASHALNGKGRVSARTREEVQRVAREIGFQADPLAQRLASGRCNSLVGLFALYLDLGVVTLKLQRIQQLLCDSGYGAPIYAYGGYHAAAPEHQATLMSSLRRQRPQAIVCNTSGLDEAAIHELERFREEGGILVCYDDLPQPLDCDTVIFDREHNTYQATRHLLELGHRNVGLHIGGSIANERRRAGFERALREFGVQPVPQWYFRCGPNEQGGVALAQEFLALRDRPTGLVIVNDNSAAAFITTVQRQGLRVPRDVSVVGHDDMPIGALACSVPLTTAAHPVESISQAVVDLLRTRLDDSYVGPARRETVVGDLIVRESAGLAA